MDDLFDAAQRHFDATQRHYRGYWNDLWFRIAARQYIEEARTELARLMDEYTEEPSEYYFEELAREVAYESVPDCNDEIAALAELCPQIWEKTGELDSSWGPGTEHQALAWAIGYLIFEALLDRIRSNGRHGDDDQSTEEE